MEKEQFFFYVCICALEKAERNSSLPHIFFLNIIYDNRKNRRIYSVQSLSNIPAAQSYQIIMVMKCNPTWVH